MVPNILTPHLPIPLTNATIDNCSQFNNENIFWYHFILSHTYHWSSRWAEIIMATIIMLTATAMNYVNSVDYAGTSVCVYMCVRVYWRNINYSLLYATKLCAEHTHLTLAATVVLLWWWMGLLNGKVVVCKTTSCYSKNRMWLMK